MCGMSVDFAKGSESCLDAQPGLEFEIWPTDIDLLIYTVYIYIHTYIDISKLNMSYLSGLKRNMTRMTHFLALFVPHLTHVFREMRTGTMKDKTRTYRVIYSIFHCMLELCTILTLISYFFLK